MNEAHQRFHDWLISGAEGDPPRDVAVHASVCAGCQRSIDALDTLAGVNTGLASTPAEPIGREHGRLALAGPLAGATAVLFSAAILGVGVSHLIGVSHPSGEVAQASPTPDQNVLGGTATAQPGANGSSGGQATPRETLSPLGTPQPTHPHPGVTPIPFRSAAPTLAASTAPSSSAAPSPVPTAAPTAVLTPAPTPAPTPVPTVPGPPQSLSADTTSGVLLSWQPPLSDGGSPVTSYNVYQATSSGAETFYQTVVGTSFQDSGAVSGMTYYYYVTAVNSVGESGPSTELLVTVP